MEGQMAIQLDEGSSFASRRFLNDAIRDTAARFDDPAAFFEFLCECGDSTCRQLVRMTLTAYSRATPGSVTGHG
jgi:hypothetical protein